MRRLFIYLLLLICAPNLSFAQSSVPLTLEVLPAFPEAGESYTVALKNLSSFGTRSNIEWFINGAEKAQEAGQTQITLQAEKTPTRITARVLTATGGVYEVTKTVSPYRIDLIIESDTYVPWFYKGRSLPANGSAVTAKALVFKDAARLQSGLSYLWKLGNAVQRDGAVVGGDSFTFTPSFEDEVLLSVEVFDARNNVIGTESQYIPVVEPEMYFYEKNPLRGILPTALFDPHVLIGDEMILRAEPFYITKGLARDGAVREWEIDGVPTEAGDDPHEITLRKEGGDGSATVSFHIRNLKNLLQGIKKEITITY